MTLLWKAMITRRVYSKQQQWSNLHCFMNIWSNCANSMTSQQLIFVNTQFTKAKQSLLSRHQHIFSWLLSTHFLCYYLGECVRASRQLKRPCSGTRAQVTIWLLDFKLLEKTLCLAYRFVVTLELSFSFKRKYKHQVTAGSVFRLKSYACWANSSINMKLRFWHNNQSLCMPNSREFREMLLPRPNRHLRPFSNKHFNFSLLIIPFIPITCMLDQEATL